MSAARLVLILTPTSAAAESTAGRLATTWLAEHRGARIAAMPPSRVWPFMYPLPLPSDNRPLLLWMTNVHDALADTQQGGTRLVTTQATYLLEAIVNGLTTSNALCLVTGDRSRLAADAPALVGRRGRFAHVEIVESVPAASRDADFTPPPLLAAPDQAERLAAAFRMDSPPARLGACVAALEAGRSPAALLATASACMEVNDLVAAARDLDEAVGLAPEWPAVWFERGKLWLRRDEMTRASEDFREAAMRMPGFGPAWSNLGATLGELDRPAEALRAFESALACDPASHQTVNNVGVVQRELGQLADSEASFRTVIALAPDMAFGYYNLGHTLFLQGRYQAALQAYVEGQRRDPARNPVQVSRLALCRLASGDAAGAVADLRGAIARVPRESRRQLLDDTQAIAWALLTDRPELSGWRLVNDWLVAERARQS